MGAPLVGVLALQGAFAKHMAMLHSIQVKAKPVRRPQELKECDALVIPGGETTTMMRRIDFIGLREFLVEFAEKKPIFGTCAGLVLMAKEVVGGSVTPLGLMNIVVERNGYGRQYESFSAGIFPLFPEMGRSFRGVFIRAPRLRRVGKGVTVLATFDGEPVLVQQNHFLAASFHPELTDNSAIHRFFLNLVKTGGQTGGQARDSGICKTTG
ncbi:MAG: pyridoxal 5'-phosphate synthase glutaminase subunit PdxT [Waddliaceae bacterium]